MFPMPSLGSVTKGWRRWVAGVAALAAIASVVAWRAWRPSGPAPAPAPAVIAAPVEAAAPEPAAPAPAPEDRPRHVRVTLDGPLETAFVAQLGRGLGQRLTQVVTRSLVWWVAVPGDLKRGDVVDVLFTERADAEPLVYAVRFRSEKLARTLAAYRFQPTGAPFARFFQRDGQELELRLQDAPLDEPEQVTSLLRDGRGHKGIDFRTPAGTPVKATFDAVIARKNWSFRANGNCLDLREQGGAGRAVYFLHLSELPADLRVGATVKKGQVVAHSGNTGHSFAPHLHYQLMSAKGTILDPFAGPTFRRALPDSERPRFEAELRRLDALLPPDAELAGR
jgi:murein DD-endopeptidase MepM/ murein hydrolase activator NlpD